MGLALVMKCVMNFCQGKAFNWLYITNKMECFSFKKWPCHVCCEAYKRRLTKNFGFITKVLEHKAGVNRRIAMCSLVSSHDITTIVVARLTVVKQHYQEIY